MSDSGFQLHYNDRLFYFARMNCARKLSRAGYFRFLVCLHSFRGNRSINYFDRASTPRAKLIIPNAGKSTRCTRKTIIIFVNRFFALLFCVNSMSLYFLERRAAPFVTVCKTPRIPWESGAGWIPFGILSIPLSVRETS